MSEGGIILGFTVRGGGMRFGCPGCPKGGGAGGGGGGGGGGFIFYFLRGGGADLFWNNPLSISSINSTHFREMFRPQFSFMPRGGLLLRKVRRRIPPVRNKTRPIASF